MRRYVIERLVLPLQTHTQPLRTRTRFAAYPPCTGTIHRSFAPQSPQKTTARNSNLSQFNATAQSNKLHPMPVSYPCNVHGHHNRNHHIIIPLNTRISDNYSSQLSPLPRSDNPLPKTRTNLLPRKRETKNRYAHPDAPKPIHTDKEHFCSQTTRLGANIQRTQNAPFAE